MLFKKKKDSKSVETYILEEPLDPILFDSERVLFLDPPEEVHPPKDLPQRDCRLGLGFTLEGSYHFGNDSLFPVDRKGELTEVSETNSHMFRPLYALSLFRKNRSISDQAEDVINYLSVDKATPKNTLT